MQPAAMQPTAGPTTMQPAAVTTVPKNVWSQWRWRKRDHSPLELCCLSGGTRHCQQKQRRLEGGSVHSPEGPGAPDYVGICKACMSHLNRIKTSETKNDNFSYTVPASPGRGGAAAAPAAAAPAAAAPAAPVPAAHALAPVVSAPAAAPRPPATAPVRAPAPAAAAAAAAAAAPAAVSVRCGCVALASRATEAAYEY
jgi:hypothetical protein